MSNIEISKKFDGLSSLGINDINSLPINAITFARRNNEKLVYCNHPEQIKKGHFGEDKKFLNRVVVEKGKQTQLYASYEFKPVDSNNKIAVRVYNPNSITVSVGLTKIGYNCSNNYDVACEAWKQYNKSSTNTRISIGAKQSAWLITKNAPSTFVELLALMEANAQVVVAVYACKNVNNVPAETTCIERTEEDDDTYSGWSENYSLHATETLQASVLLAANKKSIFYWLANPTITNKNKNESIPIYLVQNGEEVSFENGGNIGHYGVIYHFAMTLKNNTNKTVKFKGYILSNNKSLCAGIQSGSNADGYFLGSEGAGVGANKMRWNFYESKALKPNEVLMPEFNYTVLN